MKSDSEFIAEEINNLTNNNLREIQENTIKYNKTKKDLVKLEKQIKKQNEIKYFPDFFKKIIDRIKRYKLFYFFVFIFILFVMWGLGSIANTVSSLNSSNLNSFISKVLYGLKFFALNEDNKLNWVAIGAIGVLISYWITIKENAKKIDADLKAQARIDWIQEVKLRTANVISVSSRYLNPKGNNLIDNKDWYDLQESITLLMLQFGPDNSGEIQEEIKFDKNNNNIIVSTIAEQKLINKVSNENKNDYIILFIESLNEYLKVNNPLEIKNKIEDLNLKEIEFIRDWQKYGYFEADDLETTRDAERYYRTLGINEKIAYFEDFFIAHVEVDEKILQDKIFEYQQARTNLKNAQIIGHNSFVKLSKIIRIYLKIEWDIAKEGK